jgi:RNA polymerase sigma-70 factor, ECF subfamily
MHPAVTVGGGGQVGDEALAAVRVRCDPEVFTEVYDRYFRAIYLYVAARLGTGPAEDIAAETFAVAFGQRDRFDPARGGLRPWLFGIATNLVARYRRTEARHYRALARARDMPSAASHEDRVVAKVAARRVLPQLLAALAALSQGERDVVLLVAVSQLSHEEVAQALGISAGTVGSRLSRARKRLREAVSQEALNG